MNRCVNPDCAVLMQGSPLKKYCSERCRHLMTYVASKQTPRMVPGVQCQRCAVLLANQKVPKGNKTFCGWCLAERKTK